jgi:hypothetical protein
MGPAILVRHVVWSSFGKLSPGGSNLVPVSEDWNNCPHWEGGISIQVALVHCHKDSIHFVLFGIQGDYKMTVKRMA